MKRIVQKHNIDTVFILLLFAVFAMTVVAVLALGANQYKKLVERDNNAYNKRVITSYVAAKIRGCDMAGAAEAGGFRKASVPDGVETLHLYQTIEGEKFDQRIYCYNGYLYELLTTADNEIEPEAGNRIMEARQLSFDAEGDFLQITAVDKDGRESRTAVTLRSGEVSP